MNNNEDELFLSTDDDSCLESVEIVFLNNIRDQISNKFGNFTGEFKYETDYILEYVRTTMDGDDNTIENFEDACKASDKEAQYDTFTNGLIQIFEECLGVVVDLDREITYFSDLYDIYLTFVLFIKENLVKSSKNYYFFNGISDKMPKNFITEYVFSDEFCAADDFVRYAAKGDNVDESLRKVDDNFAQMVYYIEQDKFLEVIKNVMVNGDMEDING